MKPGRHKSLLMALVLYASIALYIVIGVYLILTVNRADHVARLGQANLTLAVPAGLKTSEIYRRKVREFEAAHPEVSVRLLEISGNYYQKILVMVAGKVAPDLMWMGQSFSEFADRDVFLDITDRLNVSDLKLGDFRPEILDLYQRNGRMYSLPFGIDASFIAYNRKLFREAGIPYPKDDWTFEEFLKSAQALMRRDKVGRVLCYGYRGGLPLEVFGASLFDRSSGNVTCDRPEMINYFKTNA